MSVSAALSKTCARGDDFIAVVKIIEQFYHVKYQSIPLLARAAIKTTRTVAHIANPRKLEVSSRRGYYMPKGDFDQTAANK